MKITGSKGGNARQLLELAADLVESIGRNYPVLAEDLQIELHLQGEDGTPCPRNDAEFCLDGAHPGLDIQKQTALEDIYNYDALTGLYNRGRYERDLVTLQVIQYGLISVAYIDAVGLHEINNHLGHQAGDEMLQCVANGIRQTFPQGAGYRVGGDEYVVLCLDMTKKQMDEQLFQLRKFVSQAEFEISVGSAQCDASSALAEAVNAAEHAMRRHKAEYYAQNGAERQMRTLNHKLEKLLQEKQDASQFLNVIAPRYLGVYMINPRDDSCRYIYIPKYFQKMLEEHDGRFSPAIRQYCDTFVTAEDRKRFLELINYQYVRKELMAGQSIDFVYHKKDGGRVRLKITIYDSSTPENEEMQWIFVDDTI